MVRTTGDPEFWRQVEREAASVKPAGFTPDLVSWGAGPDSQKLWIPEGMTPLAGSPAYGDLTEEQKLRYNQYCALEMVEKVAWIESYGITPSLVSLLAGDLPTPALRQLLQSVLIDELHHTAAEWHLLCLARNDLYRKNKMVLFRPPPSVVRLVTTISRMPRLLSGWVLFCGFLEEQLSRLSKELTESGNNIDPLFAQVFTLHAADEARHKRINALIAQWLIAPQGRMAKWINGRVVDRLSKAYHDTGWGGDGPVLKLVEGFPELATRSARLVEETKRGRARRENAAPTDPLPELSAAEPIELFRFSKGDIPLGNDVGPAKPCESKIMPMSGVRSVSPEVKNIHPSAKRA